MRLLKIAETWRGLLPAFHLQGESILIKPNKKDLVFTFIFLVLSVTLLIIPTGFERNIYYNAVGAKALVLSTNDSTVIQTGLFRQGEQRCRVRILSGEHRGYEGDAINLLSGSLKDDKMFSPGETAWTLVERDGNGSVIFINMIDHYRLAKEAFLAFLLIASLIAFSRLRGLRTVLSFIFAFLLIWKILIPLALKGYNPLLTSSAVLIVMTIFTLLLISGVNKRALSAILGSVSAIIITVVISRLATWYLGIHGSVLEQSESLLYSGFMDLDLTSLFSGVVILSAGGAIMDLAIDVSAAMWEVNEHAKNISRKELFRSGMEVGRAGVGTQCTTLLLAYMGSFLTVMMVYMAQSTPTLNILTGKSMGAEILQSVIGAFSLILVTPLTCAFASLIFKNEN